MIRIKQIKLPVDSNSKENLIKKTAQKLKIKENKIEKLIISKLSLDARKTPTYVYEVDVKLENEKKYLKNLK